MTVWSQELESESLHERAQRWVHAFERGEAMPETFDALACDLARYQARAIPGYARLGAARGTDFENLRVAGGAPAVPTDAFKVTTVAAFPKERAVRTFKTSGTTVGARGQHGFRTLSTYRAASVAFGRWALLGDGMADVRVLVLGPSPDEAPDSSLTCMMAWFLEAFSTEEERRRPSYFLSDGVFDLTALDWEVAQALSSGPRPVLLLGTSFAFVHFLDAIGEDSFPLPSGSRIMQTGGFKGKSREVAPAELRRELSRVFAVPESAIVAEYGMTELSSQFYETTVRNPGASHGVYAEPPWARVIPVDPDSLLPVKEGDVGIARIEDLMNVDSAFAVLVPDRVRRVRGGFELLGRAPGAPPRGCSLAIDEILG